MDLPDDRPEVISPMKRVEAHSLVDDIAQQLETAIVSGELRPGTKLSEQGLAKTLGVSRSPLREAIRRLEGRKLIERTPNIGARVAQLSPTELYDLLVVREALEGMASRRAAENMTEADVARLRELLHEHALQQEASAGAGYYQQGRDFDFHFLIIRASRNDRLIAMLCDDLYDLLRVYRYNSSTKPGRAKKALEEHEAIVEAIASRDGDRAEDAMRRHLRNARAHLERELADQGSVARAPGPGAL